MKNRFFDLGVQGSLARLIHWCKLTLHSNIHIIMNNNQETGYVLVNKELLILGNSIALHKWLPEVPSDLTNQRLTDIFPMLVGYEDLLEKIVQQQRTEPLIISQIHYSAADGHGYFDLQVEACGYAKAVLLITFTDVTKPSRLEQAVRQERNELRLQIIEREKVELVLRKELMAHKQTALELQQAKEAAEVANRLKSAFIANMSHELRTPLNGILGYAQILKRDKTLGEKQQEGVDIIQRSGDNLLSLINDILELSKIEAHSVKFLPTDLNFDDLMAEINELFKMKAEEKGISFDYQALTPLPTIIHADAERLRQIFFNLLSNAVKFTESGGVTFKVSSVQKPSAKILNLNWKIRFEVEDSGIGIEPTDFFKIFLPFQQVGDSYYRTEGSGLGLAISKQLVEMMGGNLYVDSRLGQGAKFWMELDFPEVSDVTPKKLDNDKGTIIGIQGPPRKILVVDDQWEDRFILVELLRPLGFEVMEASNGLESVEKAQQWLPDVILMDLVMSGMSGLDATRRIRESVQVQLPELVIIAISAYSYEKHREESDIVGCNDFISKPIQTDDVLEKLRQHLKLEWVYEVSPESEEDLADQLLVGPPAQVAKMLYRLANIGDVVGIIDETKKLEKNDEKFRPFARKLRRFARSFQVQKARELIKYYLE